MDVCEYCCSEDESVQLRMCGHTLCEDCAFACIVCDEEEKGAGK